MKLEMTSRKKHYACKLQTGTCKHVLMKLINSFIMEASLQVFNIHWLICDGGEIVFFEILFIMGLQSYSLGSDRPYTKYIKQFISVMQ
jgi:hypothetical protein